MPLFFIVSGVFYKNNSGKIRWKWILNKVKVLLIPLFAFSILKNLFIALFGLPNGISFSVNYFIKNTLLIFQLKIYSAMWFLLTMFLAVVLFEILTVTRKFRPIVCFILGIIGIYIGKVPFPVSLSKWFVALAFYALGYYLKNIFLKSVKWYYIVGMLVLYVVCFYLNPDVSMASCIYGNPIFYYGMSVTGSFLVVQLCRVLVKVAKEENIIFKYLTFIGKNTLIILCTHGALIEFIRVLDMKFFNEALPNLGILEGIIVTILIFVLEVPVIIIINKYFPFLLGKFKINKKSSV